MLQGILMGLVWVAGRRQLPGSVGVYIRKDPQTSPREFNEEHVQVIQVGGICFYRKLTPGIWKWIPFGKGKTSTRNHQLLGFQLSIFVGCEISGMWDSGLNQGWLFFGGKRLVFWHRLVALMKMRCSIRVPKRIWPRVLSTRFAFFVGGLGREFCLLVPPFPRWAWFEKRGKTMAWYCWSRKKFGV